MGIKVVEMKHVLVLFVAIMFSCIGCVSYTIDSKPQGLRVVVNDLEYGITPCEYSTYTDGNNISTEICVYPPTVQQVSAYEDKNDVRVNRWITESQSKKLYSEKGGGTVLFNFIEDEVIEDLKAKDEYIVDSKPQGLRVVVDGIERGITPCVLNRKDYLYKSFIRITVLPATDKQLFFYGSLNKKVVSTFYTGEQSRVIDTRVPGGTILFDFILKEYDKPQTEEEEVWLIERLEEDAKELEWKKNNSNY